ncbi:hypothetical protein [Brevibacillus reuszeri]|uniref:hypothetical protein n=1 Tax=Brevibacillus reuszeri TaxID=54915 RepID=UPI003D248545
MFSFVNVLFESPFVKLLAIAIIIGACIGAPYYIPWFESTYFGQRLIEEGIWPDNMVLWPYEAGMKMITLGAIGVILTGYLSVAIFAILVILMLGFLIVPPIILLKRKIKEIRDDWNNAKAVENITNGKLEPGYRIKGNGKIVRVKS